MLEHLLSTALENVVDVVGGRGLCCSTTHLVVELLLLTIGHTTLDCDELKHALVSSALQNLLFDGIFRDKTIDTDRLLLTDTMSSSHGLQICLRVPIGIEDDDGISSHQVDTEATRPSR